MNCRIGRRTSVRRGSISVPLKEQFLARLQAATSNEEWKQILVEIKQAFGEYPQWFYEEVFAHHVTFDWEKP